MVVGWLGGWVVGRLEMRIGDGIMPSLRSEVVSNAICSGVVLFLSAARVGMGRACGSVRASVDGKRSINEPVG